MSTRAPSRHRVRRAPKRAAYDRETIDAILDAAVFCHVAFVHEGEPFCIPTLHARLGDEVYVHGSTASRMLRTLAEGARACLTVTTLHGLVLARSAFEHSANYESAVILGSFRLVEDPDERLVGFEAFTEKLLPGRWDEVRGPNRKELKATQILAIPIDEASAKVRTGPPSDDDSEDAALDTWAGVLPITTTLGEPQPSPGLREGIPLAGSVRRMLDVA